MTITTVGYGDYYPVTLGGRLTGIFVMFAGIGIIGALASILASLLVSPSAPAPDAPMTGGRAERERRCVIERRDVVDVAGMAAVAKELAGLRAEVAGQRAEIAALRSSLGGGR